MTPGALLARLRGAPAWLLPALVTLCTGVAIVALLEPADLTNPARSAATSRGEDVVAYGALFVAGVLGTLVAWRGPRLARVEAALGRVPAWALPAAAAAAWGVGWVRALAAQDPDWLASGIDWHDTLLEAYALRFDDPAFYCANRYPLYPALTALVSARAGVELDVALQVVSRGAMLLLPVPLWIVGRALFGRAATLVGIGLLVTVPTVHHHFDAATPYPLYVLETAAVVAGLVGASRGRLWGFGLFGVALGASLATDPKALVLALATLPIAAVLAVGATSAPVEGAAAAAGKGGAALRALRGALHRAVRVALVVAPLVGSYRWMGGLAVAPLTLEELSSNTLFPAEWPRERYVETLANGYLWGRWSGWDQVPRTLATFRASAELEELDAARAFRFANTRIKAARDYPGTSLRVLGVAAAGLALAVLRGRRPLSARVRTLIVSGSVLAIAATCIPPMLNDYQDRYFSHALIFVPLLVVGAGDVVLRAVVGTGTRVRAAARTVVLAGAAVTAATWSGFPLAAERAATRIEGVRLGGAAERAVQAWADANMQPGDVLLDTSWMMTAALVAGRHTVLREDPVYPPPGVPLEPGWRATRPWAPATGTAWVLVPNGGEPPPQGGREWVPARFPTDPDFEAVDRIPTAMATIYRYRGDGIPLSWRLPRSLR